MCWRATVSIRRTRFRPGATVAAGKKLAVIMNAGTAHITTMAPYSLRVV